MLAQDAEELAVFLILHVATVHVDALPAMLSGLQLLHSDPLFLQLGQDGLQAVDRGTRSNQ